MKWFDKMRAQYVKRWHTVHMDHDQSLADHTFNVMIIARELARRLNHDGDEQRLVLEAALEHDLNEVVTGDIPTPTKNRLSPDSKGHLAPNHFEGWGPAESIVKVADMLEAYFQITQHASGTHSGQVFSYMCDQTNDYLDWLAECGSENETLAKKANEMIEEFFEGDRTW